MAKSLGIILGIFLISSCSTPTLKFDINFQEDIKPLQLEVTQGAEFSVSLGVGEKLTAIEIQNPGEFQIEQQTQTAITITNEGPHWI